MAISGCSGLGVAELFNYRNVSVISVSQLQRAQLRLVMPLLALCHGLTFVLQTGFESVFHLRSEV